jgi:L-ribulose-5-phosphate 3-epimerase
MKLGTMVYMDMERLDEEFAALKEMGFGTCQLCCWQPERFTPENAAKVRELIRKHAVEVSAFWCGWPGPCEWNLVQGPVTIGLVPPAYRGARLDALKRGSDFSAELGVEDIVTHVGFIPNNPFDADYAGLVGALRHLARHCAGNGQYFLFETGQEAPVTLLRTIEDIGAENAGVNLDPANLLMYGYGNPTDALDVFGRYVRNVHGKDGACPVSGRALGAELPIGQGRVNYPEFIRKLKDIGYDRYITIEREISGEEQRKDILAAKKLLEELWRSA